MMIVDYAYFTGSYLGEGVAESDFPRLEMRSEDALNDLTRGQLDNFDSFDSDIQTLVKKAICAQIEYYENYTTEVGFSESEKGFTVGKVSVTSGQAEGEKTFISPRAIGYLERAGLLLRVVGVC